MSKRVINDPSALGWEFDATTGRWTWSGGGSSGGGGGGGDSYGQWNLQAGGGQPFAVTSNEYVNFEGSGGIAVTRSGNYITIDGSGISGGGSGTESDNYQYWRYQVNGADTTSVMTMNTVNFRAGSNVTLSKVADGIEISATGGSGGSSYTLPLASNGTRGGVQVGFATSGRNYAVQLSGEKMYVNVPWTDSGNTTYGEATSSVYGLVKIGYSANGKNYPVQLSSGRMYVNVPWTDSGGGASTDTWDDTLKRNASTVENPAAPNYYTISNTYTLGGVGGAGARIISFDGQFNFYNSSNATTVTFSKTGDITATADVTAFSDVRLKEDIKTLDGSKVYDMRGVSFTKNGRQGSGVIAQELLEVAPELVHDEGEYLSVAYGNLVGYLIEAVKELKAEVEELKNGGR